MADDRKTEDKAAGTSWIGAFTMPLTTQQKYILVNLDTLNSGLKNENVLAGLLSHETFHAYGLDHPINPTQPGETVNSRTWEQLYKDIASHLSTANAFGTPNGTGQRIVTYSFAGDTGNVIPRGGDGVTVDAVRNVSDDNNQQNRRIKAAMQKVFAEHSNLLGVTFQEAADPSQANLLVYAGSITDTPVAMTGHKNPYNQDVTIMTYTAADRRVIYPMSGVGDIWALQNIYGRPPEDPKRQTITAERLYDHSGVLWDHEPMAIKLTGSPMLGSLIIDMGADPYSPSITGTLKAKDGKEVYMRQHIGAFASINELDARDSKIKLDITGKTNAYIYPNKGAHVTLAGRNSYMPSSGGITITHKDGFGHDVTRLAPDDVIEAQKAKKARLQYWNDAAHEKGTLVTLVGDDAKNKGSIFVRDRDPNDVLKHLKGITLADKEDKKPAITLDAINGDSQLKEPQRIDFEDAKDVAVTAHKAAGFGLNNTGGGKVIIKMTQPEYDSRIVSLINDGKNRYYSLSFRDNTEDKKIYLQPASQIAIYGPDGQITRIVSLKDSLKEFELDIALKKGLRDISSESATLAALPYKHKERQEQVG